MVSSNCQQFIITRVVRNCQYQNGLWACLCRIALNALMGKDLAYTSVASFEVFFTLNFQVVEAEQQTCMHLFLPNFSFGYGVNYLLQGPALFPHNDGS